MPNRLRLNDSVTLLLWKLTSQTNRGMQEALKPLGFHPREGAILASIGQLGPLSQRRLSQLLEIDRSTMVTSVDRLEELNLVEREACATDRRVALVTLTSRGEQALREAKRQLDDFESGLLSGLTKTEQAVLRETLRKVATPEQT